MSKKQMITWGLFVLSLILFSTLQPAQASTAASVSQENDCGPLSQEAEHGQLFGEMRVGKTKKASGKRYVFVPRGVNGSDSFESSSDRVEFCVEIPKDGDYQIKTWVYARNGKTDSMFVSVDNLPSATYLWDAVISGGFSEDFVSDRDKSDPQTIKLTAGSHILTFANRESRTKLDRFEVILVNEDISTPPVATATATATATQIPTDIPPTAYPSPTQNPTSTPPVATATQMPTSIPPTAYPSPTQNPTSTPPVATATQMPTDIPPTAYPSPTSTSMPATATPEPQPTTAACGGLTQEAENALLFGQMAIGNSNGASGGQYIFTAENVTDVFSIDTENHAEFCVNITTAGNYQIEAAVKATDNNSDSYFVTVDESPSAGYLWDAAQSSNFIADQINDRGKSDPQIIYFSAGEHKITFHHRESGTLLDKITLVLLSDPDEATPTATQLPPTATSTPVATPTSPPGPSSGKVEIGMSDLPGRPSMFRLPDGVSYRQQYLAGGAGKGWSVWNANGDFAKYYMERSQELGTGSIFTLYHLCQSGYDNASEHPCYTDETSTFRNNLSSQDTMYKYWADLKLFYEKAAQFPNQQVILHVEPDMWGYMQKASANDDAANYSSTVQVSGSGHPDLAGLPNTPQGFAKALFRLRDAAGANHVTVAYHVSNWGNNVDFAYSNPSQSEAVKLADRSVAFYQSLNQPFDMAFFEIRDRDAGFYEFVYGISDGWWDTQDFNNHIAIIDRFSSSTGRPIMLWQLPYGNTQSSELDNSWGKYQDNIVETLLGEPNLNTLSRYQAAGVQALIFGQGAGGTTCPCDADGDGKLDDGGYFYDIVDAYFNR